MKRFWLERLPFYLLVIVFAGIVVHAPLSVYLGTKFPDAALVIKAWKEILIGIAAVLIAIKMTLENQWRTLKTDRFGWVIIAYALLHVICLLWTQASPTVWGAGLILDLRYILFACCVYHFLLLYPHYRNVFVKILAVGACVVVGFAALQLVLPRDFLTHFGYGDTTIQPYLTVDKNPDYVRHNSTLRGPNSLGAYVVIVLALVSAWLVVRWRSIGSRARQIGLGLFAVCSVIALWISYSRSAMMAALFAVLIVLGVRERHRLTRHVWTGIVIVVVVVGVGIYSARDTNFVVNVILHDNPTTGAAIDSNTAHATSLRDGVEVALSEPVGSGIGSTGSASLLGDKPNIIENQYLMVAHETGWLGLGLFVWIFVEFLRRCWTRRDSWLGLGAFASGIGLGFVGLMLPVWADDTVALVWWGLAAIVISKGAEYERTTDKKAKRTA